MTHWTQTGSDRSYAWVPYRDRSDNDGGVDLIPVADSMAPYRATTDRPIAVWDTSTITASGFTAERKP